MTEKRTWTVRADRIEHDTKHLTALVATMLASEGVEVVAVEVKSLDDNEEPES